MGLDAIKIELDWPTGYPEDSGAGVGMSSDSGVTEDEAGKVTVCVLVV